MNRPCLRPLLSRLRWLTPLLRVLLLAIVTVGCARGEREAASGPLSPPTSEEGGRLLSLLSEELEKAKSHTAHVSKEVNSIQEQVASSNRQVGKVLKKLAEKLDRSIHTTPTNRPLPIEYPRQTRSSSDGGEIVAW